MPLSTPKIADFKILTIDRLVAAITGAGILLGASFIETLPSSARQPKSFPTHGKLVRIEKVAVGPLCAIDLIDDRGKKYTGIQADGKICARKNLLNQTVNLTYKVTRVRYCDSPDTCFDKKLNIIVRMNIQEQE
jgi:hypothetical protein